MMDFLSTATEARATGCCFFYLFSCLKICGSETLQTRNNKLLQTGIHNLLDQICNTDNLADLIY
jgi:hypothetical protein